MHQDVEFANEAEKLYFKLLSAKEQLDSSSDTDTVNTIVGLMKKIHKDIEKTGNTEYIEKAKALIVVENDEDTETIKKGRLTIFICLIVAIISLVGSILLVIASNNSVAQKKADREALVEREFRAEIEQKIEDVRTGYSLDEYHIKKITYDITDIKWYQGERGLIYIKCDATYDAEKYNNIIGSGADSITFELEQMCWNYEFKASNGWRFEVIEQSTVNGSNAKYSKGNTDMLPYWSDNAKTYSDSNPSLIILAIGIAIIVVMIIIINKKKTAIEKAKYNMRGKTKLKYVSGKGKKFLVAVCVVLVIGAAGTGAFYYIQYTNNEKLKTYSEAEQFFLAKDYDNALSKYSTISGYEDSDQKVVLIKYIVSEDYENAVANCGDILSLYPELSDELNSKLKEYYYAEAVKYFEEKDFEAAETYLKKISGYKDVDNMLSNIDLYSKYYEALEYESVSVIGAVEIYKTLPADFLDVSEIIAKYEPYLECVGTVFGNPNGYIVDGIKITDYSVNDDGKMVLHTWNLSDMTIDKPTKSGYLFSVTDSRYGRTWNISADAVTITIDGVDKPTWYK